MKLIKVNFHSAVDVITNSSTTIFTYSGGCAEKAKELIDEFLKVLGSDKKTEDMFWMGVFIDDLNKALERLVEDLEEDSEEDDPLYQMIEKMDYKEQREWAEDQLKKVLTGEIEKPEWMKNAEEYEDWDGFTAETSLYITAKEEKYKDLAEKITDFLYSTQCEGTYNG